MAERHLEWAGVLLLAVVSAVALALLHFAESPLERLASGGWFPAALAVAVCAAAYWAGPLFSSVGRMRAAGAAVGVLVIVRVLVQAVPGVGLVLGIAAVASAIAAVLLVARALMVSSPAGGRLVPAGLALGGAIDLALSAVLGGQRATSTPGWPGWVVALAECLAAIVMLRRAQEPWQPRPIIGFSWARGTPHLALLGPYLALVVLGLTNVGFGQALTGADRLLETICLGLGQLLAFVIVALCLRTPTWAGRCPQPGILVAAVVLVVIVVELWWQRGSRAGPWWGSVPASVVIALGQIALAVVTARALAPRPLDVLPAGSTLAEQPINRRSTVATRVGLAALGAGVSYGLITVGYQQLADRPGSFGSTLFPIAAAVLLAGAAVIRRPWQPATPNRGS